MQAIYTFLIAFLLIIPVYGQKPVKCRVKDNHAPKYKVGWNEYDTGKPAKLIITISIEPQYFNRNDMTTFARQLNKVYCREQKISAIILDNRRAAKEWGPSSTESIWFDKHVRGIYNLDRITGKEEVSFSTEPGKPIDEIKIS